MNPSNNYQSPSLVLNLNAKAFLTQKSQKKNIVSPANSNVNFHNQSNRIKEEFADNFILKIKTISGYLTQYPYV